MEADPASLGVPVFIAVATVVYGPGGDGSDVTFRVVVPMAPGATVRLGAVKMLCQPIGAVAWSAKLDGVHGALSLFFTEIV